MNQMGNFRRFSVWMFLVSARSSVICQNLPVKGFVGDDVLLPCNYSESVLEKVSVTWRDENNTAVLNIRDGRQNLTYQNQKYSSRVSSFQKEYMKGNFSILMKNLKMEDAGEYECFVHDVKHRRNINLTVLGKSKAEKKTMTRSGGAAGINLCSIIFLSALCLLLCF